MNAIVVYYSRSGNTAEVARAIATALDANIEAIVDKTSRKGLVGYMRSAYEATFARLTTIEQPTHDLSRYDLVVMGSPVWNASLSSPVRTFMARHRKDMKAVAFFCTCGGRGAERVFEQMSDVTGKTPADTLVLRERELQRSYSDKVAGFARELRSVIEPHKQVVVPAA